MESLQEQVYQQFLHFDWDSLPEFVEGLGQILDSHLASLKEQDPLVSTIPAAERQQLVDQAKSFFFCSHTGHILNLDEFYAWKRNNGDKISLVNEPSADEIAPQDEGSSDSAEVPYSSNYQNVVELIMAGKPVPGIKEIPDTVLTEQASESTSAARKKPWEN